MAVYSNSRYATAKLTKVVLENGEIRPYVHDRKVIYSDELRSPMQVVNVTAGTEIDQLAYKYYGDETQYWRIADVNDLLFPLENSDFTGSNAYFVGRNLYIP